MLRHGTTASDEGYGEVPLERKQEIAQRLWTGLRERLGAAAIRSTNLPNRGTGPNGQTPAAEPSQSPTAEPSPLTFGDRTATPRRYRRNLLKTPVGQHTESP